MVNHLSKRINETSLYAILTQYILVRRNGDHLSKRLNETSSYVILTQYILD